jgi:predicted nucleotidyltransferase
MVMLQAVDFQELVKCYNDYLGDQLISIVLFGSRARGDAQETSDYDLFIIARQLPSKPLHRMLYIRSPLKGQFEERFCIIARTPEEVEKNFPPFYLDLGLDGVILFDGNDFFRKLQERIRDIIRQAGLRRKKDNEEYYWEWETPPKRGWEITWSGYRAF